MLITKKREITANLTNFPSSSQTLKSKLELVFLPDLKEIEFKFEFNFKLKDQHVYKSFVSCLIPFFYRIHKTLPD